jgi:hypothetical protein
MFQADSRKKMDFRSGKKLPDFTTEAKSKRLPSQGSVIAKQSNETTQITYEQQLA